MRFAFTDDQTLFAEGLRDLLAKECPPARVRAAWDDGAGHDARTLGPSRRDGRVRHARARGRRWPRRYRGRSRPAAGGARACRRAGPCDRDRGRRRPCARRRVGRRHRRPRRFTVRRRTRTSPSVVLVPRRCAAARGRHVVSRRRHRRWPAALHGRRCRRWRPLDYDEALAFDRGALAAAAYLVGLGERMIDVAAEYARQREQYGRPIGVNQAVKHLLADALLKVEFAKPAVYRAAWSVAQSEPDTAAATSRWRRRSRATPPTDRAGRDAGARRDRVHVGSGPPALDEEGMGVAAARGATPPSTAAASPTRSWRWARDPRRPRVRHHPAPGARQRPTLPPARRPGRRRVAAVVPRARRSHRRGGARVHGHRLGTGRPGRRVGAQHRRVGDRGARRARCRRRAGSPQHAVQRCGGGVRARPERCALPLYGERLPRQRLRRHAPRGRSAAGGAGAHRRAEGRRTGRHGLVRRLPVPRR